MGVAVNQQMRAPGTAAFRALRLAGAMTADTPAASPCLSPRDGQANWKAGASGAHFGTQSRI